MCRRVSPRALPTREVPSPGVRRAGRDLQSADGGRGVERPSPAVQDYLKAIYRLAGEGDDSVSTTMVAEALGVTTPSASNMLKRLEGLGYVQGGGRRGVRLTTSGRGVALEVVRLHRLLETFLAESLGMSWDEVHGEAEVLEHHVSEVLAARIAEALGHPDRDPHGDPIPTPAGTVADEPSSSLWELPAGAGGVVRRCDDRDPALLRFLAERGLVPDARVEVLERAPFGGPLTVRASGSSVDVPPDAARAVHVAPAPGGRAQPRV